MIYGERVRLRRIGQNDLPRFVEWLNDPDVRESLLEVYPLGLAQEERWFDAMLKLEPASQPYAIEARTPGAAPADESWMHVGGTGFHGVDWRNRSAEVGIFIGAKHLWGMGCGTDALRALVHWGFQELNLHRVWLRVFEDNARAIRSYEKIGFRLEGRLRQDRFHRGRYSDTLVMGLLRDEFPGRPSR
jgi:RimJ/RimL family protein N-acetyltransferase